MTIRPDIAAYRPCVGIILFNKDGLVWIGRRFEKQNDEGTGKWWQMPQGGIDEGEDAEAAARRELYEETSVKQVSLMRESGRWYTYDLPEHLIGVSWKGKYRGQKQKWFAYRFDGQDADINLVVPGHKQEFDEWRWVKIDELIDLIIPFKRGVYEELVRDFRDLSA
jgi:putative (di)nucleoside polyphosphate hydrolase